MPPPPPDNPNPHPRAGAVGGALTGFATASARLVSSMQRAESDGAVAGSKNRHVPALGRPSTEERSRTASPFRLTMPHLTPGQLAFSAMQYLPVPLLVLNNLKTVVLANDAMARMLGMGSGSGPRSMADSADAMDTLRGQTLPQVGIDMLQDGRPVWVTWERFFDSLVQDMANRHPKSATEGMAGDETPRRDGWADMADQYVQDAVVEVVISRKDFGRTTFNSSERSRELDHQVYAKMIVTIWEVEGNQTYFTLTFTNSHSTPSPLTKARKSIARPSQLEAAERQSITNTVSNPPSLGSGYDSNSSVFRVSPGAVSLSSSAFPPMGPPSTASHASAPSILQKLSIIQTALLDNTSIPILAMWKDGSVTYPNKAAKKLFRPDADLDRPVDGFDLLDSWIVWNEDFTQQLPTSEYPISILVRTEKPFQSIRIGMCDQAGRKIVFDVLGEAVRDERTGEFLAGIITCRDVTELKAEISQIRAQDEERFKLICDTMPQLVWTSTPDGSHDFFNTRWYHYTGLTPEESLGLGWKNPFHPDDVAKSAGRWKRSLETGEPYVTEYRCRSKDGEWRWFLGRALPQRNKQTGEIEKWFGTCTDVHESIEAKLAAKRTREELRGVLSHSKVTIFTVDTQRRVTMLEGALIWDAASVDADADIGQHWYIGENMYEVFTRLNPQLRSSEQPVFLQPIEDILSGKVSEDVKEHGIDDRWYRTRFLPISAKKSNDGNVLSEMGYDGVIGIIMDVTELKNRDAELEREARGKRLAQANEAAAKEANRLKSQFLANMSHEIRTPITGVIGMAELLGDSVGLDEEQSEYVDNIQRSANALLTVINDILDLSKVESGRLDIEEVPFSLSVIVSDVKKMLEFAAERKDLDFQLDISDEIEDSLAVVGDSNRVRQILTNLISNSIKFTKEGYVRFSVTKERESAEVVEVRFTIEDSGIGIDNDVRHKLFKPFSQGDASTARRFGGTGLGLTICKNLLDLMGGRIDLESAAGRGTTVSFWIPFCKHQGPVTPGAVEYETIPDRLQSEFALSCDSSEFEHVLGTPPPPGERGHATRSTQLSPHRARSVNVSPIRDDIPASQRAKIHVLVVEDNAINQQIATKTIKKLGFNVSATWNGKEALDYLNEAKEGKHQKPDIILMDVQMPVIDGYRCTHLLRHHSPYKSFVRDVPIVAMTASAIQGDREKCTRAGMDDYLAKPVKSKTLEKMLVRWCSAGRRGPAQDESPESECTEEVEHCSNTDMPSVDRSAYDGSVSASMDGSATPPGFGPALGSGHNGRGSAAGSPAMPAVSSSKRPRFLLTRSTEALTAENIRRLEKEEDEARHGHR